MNSSPGAVAPTLCVAEAERERWQAIVVGGGPAGASCAAELAARGIRTLLLDRQQIPRAKVCGCCLSRLAIAELRGLARTPAGVGLNGLPVAPLVSVQLLHQGRAASLSLPGGGVLSRETLDPALVRAAIAAGAHWLPESRVTRVDEAPAGGRSREVSLSLSHERVCLRRTVAAEYVVWATGLGGQVPFAAGPSRVPAGGSVARRSRIGVGVIVAAGAVGIPVGHLMMAIADDGYGGIVQLEDGRLDLAAALNPASLSRGADPALALITLMTKAAGPEFVTPAFRAEVLAAVVRATPPLTRRAALVAGVSGRILRVGDAAGYVEPFTGEGIGWALAGGRLLAEALAPRPLVAGEFMPCPATVAAAYSASYRSFLGSPHRRCQRVAGMLRRPAAVAAAVSVARFAPWIASRAVPAVVGTGATSS